MPSIQVNRDPHKAEEWLSISDYHFDAKGCLTLLSIGTPEGYYLDFHLFRRDTSFLDMATAIWGHSRSLRSGRDLMKGLEKHAVVSGFLRTQSVHPRLPFANGWAFASVESVSDFLKTQPFLTDGYYDPQGHLSIAGMIDRKSPYYRE